MLTKRLQIYNPISLIGALCLVLISKSFHADININLKYQMYGVTSTTSLITDYPTVRSIFMVAGVFVWAKG